MTATFRCSRRSMTYGNCAFQTVLHRDDCNIQLPRLNCSQGIFEIAEVDQFCISHTF